MPNSLKNLVKSAIKQTTKIISKTKAGSYFFDLALSESMNRITSIVYNGVELSFATPNQLNSWRIDTFSTKEPETLEWIDTLPDNCVLWDVGANVGLYSCYACAKKSSTVYAFEPSVFNLELLARNLFLNRLSQKVTIVPFPLCDNRSIASMRLTSTEWGGALSTFGKEFGWDGGVLKQNFEFRTLGLSMDETVELLKIPVPDYIKMDVDGLEHFILKGGSRTLSQIKGILIEVNDDFYEQASTCSKLLTDAGLILREKRHSEMFADSAFGNTYNQIWTRP
ncbi:FkbM family methyltransferase [Phormidium sp. FACHB-1136]|uniref:FkbM family methyltransferase n=2 Tax=Cyanophyceae TaxID=3028117 RepID=UPI0016839528|nr:FkbM family methyltransferase [Phormidium sp. FACHB-1136]MBD2424559.1 FkbM family methyltransferase [Phormidium sp. FACHB-1136]